MDLRRWQEIGEVFDAALAEPRADRNHFLARRCAADGALRAEVESLLAAHENGSSLLDRTAFEHVTQPTPLPPALTNQRIGRYTICGVIGHGGSGVVYEARQDNPARPVALKILNRLPLLDAVTQRLVERESQALARLEHPGIATIYEAGVSEDGYSYLAMERVEGRSLCEYAAAQALDLRARLELFQKICGAVQHAHQRGVIHRDLKPGNILVTDAGQPKVLDFGLARIIDAEAGGSNTTAAGGLLGTIAYASPEQLGGIRESVDVRTDVYSLGVVLFELVTGRLPHDLIGLTIPDAIRVISEQAAPAASHFNASARGDVDAILGKALEKEPQRRYDSVAALGEDIAGFCAGRAVSAHPPSRVYLVRKWVARNRATFAMLVLVGIVIVGAVFSTSWLAYKFAIERDLARTARSDEATARASADAVSKFLESILTAASPYVGQESQPTLASIAAAAEMRLSELQDRPLVQARVMITLAQVNAALGRYEQGRQLLQTALAQQRKELGANHRDLLGTLDVLVGVLSQMGEHDGAVGTGDEMVKLAATARGAQPLDQIAALGSFGTAQYMAAKYESAAKTFEQALTAARALSPPNPQQLSDALINLGFAYRSLGRLAEAVPLLREGLLECERARGDSPELCHALQSLALATYGTDMDETLRLLQRRLDVARHIYHAQHPALADALNDLGIVTIDRDRAAALKLILEGLAVRRAAVGEAHPLVAESLDVVGQLYLQQADYSKAEQTLRESLAIRRRHFDPDDERIAHSMNSLAVACRYVNRSREAADLSEATLRIWTNRYGTTAALVGVAHQNAAAAYIDISAWDLAAFHLQRAGEVFAALNSPNQVSVMSLNGLLDLDRADFPAAAAQYCAAQAVMEQKPPPNPQVRDEVLTGAAMALHLIGSDAASHCAAAEEIANMQNEHAPTDTALLKPLIALASSTIEIDPQIAAWALDDSLAIAALGTAADAQLGDLCSLQGLRSMMSGDFRSAVGLMRIALVVHERCWGRDCWRTCVTRARLGAALAGNKQLTEARELLRASLPALVDALGPNSTECRRATSALSQLESQ